MDSITQARKARVLAEITAGNVGFHARLMQAGGNSTCLALGRQADAELLQRDLVAKRAAWDAKLEADRLQGEVTRLQAVISRQDREIAELRKRLGGT